MKIFDCTTFYSEHMMMDVRFNILDKHVHKFIVVESLFSHSGEKKKLNFDINNYPKFKDKIIYLVIEKEPEDIILSNGAIKQSAKRLNSLKRIYQSYDFMQKGIETASSNDLILLSDNDEIPNLDSYKFKNSKKDLFIFKQLFFYYKFNLLYDLMPWHGSRGCKKKNLRSFSWLKNLKNKKYPFWRIDTYFSKYKSSNLDIIDDGGWHFTHLKTPEELFIKLKNFGHHDEFDISGLTLDDVTKKIEGKKVFYNHFVDQTNPNKWEYDYMLKKIENKFLPDHLIENKNKYKEWFDQND
jgi:beta-1,4-mannosyl-glycoprotein beta-1,4-N-acetylglucosaminyltransferase|tara:strand:+ start:789 stop:1679 length:891 start_codon:yes stop_codon:yes gene_type:complete